MTCRDYLEDYTELLDGYLPAERADDLRGHARACPACADYDRTVRRSLEELRRVETIDVADDFALRLQHRLLHVREERAGGLRGASSGMAGIVAVAAFLALAAWSPWLMERLTQPVAAPLSVESSQATSPVGAPAEAVTRPALDPWYVSTPRGLLFSAVDPYPDDPRYSLPGPSSPVIVAPPATGRPGVSGVSTRLSVEYE
ncbi:MAG: hypothetical protein WEB88_01640 [Gemmatimonadota bacterium]